jgi:hypothetical protein
LTDVVITTPATDQVLTYNGSEWVNATASATVADDSITNAKLANMAESTIKGRAAGAGTGDPTDLSSAQVKTLLSLDSVPNYPVASQAEAEAGVVTNKLMTPERVAQAIAALGSGGAQKYSVGITIDGGGSAITTGWKGYRSITVSGTITKARLLADQSGSIVIDVWKDTYANYPPTDADSITASAPPTISSAVKSEDATLTGWTTSVTAGDVLGFSVDSCSTITWAVLELDIQP